MSHRKPPVFMDAVLRRGLYSLLLLGVLAPVAAAEEGKKAPPRLIAADVSIPTLQVQLAPSAQNKLIRGLSTAAEVPSTRDLVSDPTPAAGAICDAGCDWCHCGTPNENNCLVDWFYDSECDCGCQFCDPVCADCFMQECSSSPCDPYPDCDYCWIGSDYENNCPADWCGTADGCDCGCQFTDSDCPGGTCAGSGPVCGNGSCECLSGETTTTCPEDCVDALCADGGQVALSVGEEYGLDGEMCVTTVRLCPCEAECLYCNAGDCPTSWNGDGECDCGCQFCDIDCPSYPNCCISEPAAVEVCVEVFPPDAGSGSCLLPQTCSEIGLLCGTSVLDPVNDVYVFCPSYTAAGPGSACVRLSADWPGSACDAELWWQFQQTCVCGDGLCQESCGETRASCCTDCASCGDQICDGACGESSVTCQTDCGGGVGKPGCGGVLPRTAGTMIKIQYSFNPMNIVPSIKLRELLPDGAYGTDYSHLFNIVVDVVDNGVVVSGGALPNRTWLGLTDSIGTKIDYIVIHGDVDGDHDTDALDANAIWQNRLNPVTDNSPYDIDGDGDVDALDVNAAWNNRDALVKPIPDKPSGHVCPPS